MPSAGYARVVANVLCLDFDDTIVMENTYDQVVAQFVEPEVAAEWRANRPPGLSVEQSNAALWALIDPSVTREEIAAFVREVAVVREGFLELLDWAHWNGWLATIVSLGLDVYVDPVLDALGVDRVPRHTARARRGYRWQTRYYSPRGIELEQGFKLSYAAAFRDAGDFVAYVGDGTSDIAPARLAPTVFARSTLLEALREEHPRVHPFESFHDVIRVLERDAAGWLAGQRGDASAG